tara:strand:+ start:114 stop:560 length:447 start_codon:yes stop_codon:yes gene_type:complete
MIIICPCGEKRFEVNESLIPSEGRELQCGSCNETWFFKKETIKTKQKIILNEINEEKIKKTTNNKTNIEKLDDKIDIKENEEYKIEKKDTKINLLNLIIVFIISVTALIILLDTFQSPISILIPNIDFILYNLYESIEDIILFLKDLL